MAEWGEGHLQEGGGQSGSDITMREGGRPTWSSLLARTYSLYSSRGCFNSYIRLFLAPANSNGRVG